ncbi:MAG: hypothetical protein JSW34_08440 [Candidatus Zixiibacteriota bacterium]|nr:MAG: hypothetical protein JSW34_08440 [candidate division Zixibacteria bacterium]
MKRICGLTLIGVLLGANPAMAANIAVITSPPTTLKLVVFGVAVGCVVATFKVLGVLKGGLLSKSWQLFLFAFLVLALGQLASLMGDMEILNLPGYVSPALWVLTSGLFLYAIFETKRTLE